MITTLSDRRLEIEIPADESRDRIIREVRALLEELHINPSGSFYSPPGFGSVVWVTLPHQNIGQKIQDMLMAKFPNGEGEKTSEHLTTENSGIE